MFGFRLRVPARGDDITADWARELVKAVRSLRLHAGPGARITRTPEGTTISVAQVSSAASPRKNDPAIHFGDAEDARKRNSWSVADDKPAILDLGTAKILVDSRGNVISWNMKSGGDGEESSPDDPTAPSAPPPCGNPLNADDDYNPLGGEGGGGGHDDYNPLDHEGDGGFTPTCGGEAA